MTIYVGADHAGFSLKEVLRVFLEKSGHEVIDCGAYTFDAVDDYPDFIKKVAEHVSKNARSRGIVLGGSGQGEAMVANRYAGVRCAVFYGPVAPKILIDAEGHASSDPYAMVKLERLHNDANVISIGARFVAPLEAQRAVELFLSTPFSAGERHVRRIAKF